MTGTHIQVQLKNLLSKENSPYLLQYAEQEIAWQPWGEKAFEKARVLHRPVFLSIGYATSHWCQVMKNESFEDSGIAKFLNEAFVCIKVDKEERPDVDAVYMDAVQMMTRQGGWPLNVILTPDAEPYFGGCYFPFETQNGQPGLKQVLIGAALAFEKDAGSLKEKALKVFRYLESRGKDFSPRNLKLEKPFEERDSSIYFRYLEQASKHLENTLLEQADFVHGGFGMHIKFPSLPKVTGLRPGKTEKAKSHLNRTLLRLATGGIFDQLEGGVFKHCSDSEWKEPHFEKSLVENALLLEVFSVQSRVDETQKATFQSAALKTAEYLRTHLFDEQRQLYHTAQSANSEGGEGAYYFWRLDEFQQAIEESDENEKATDTQEMTRFASLYYKVLGKQNSQKDFVLQSPESLEKFLKESGYSSSDVKRLLPIVENRLLKFKAKHRVKPDTDSQVVLAHNSVLARAFMIAGLCLENEDLFSNGTQLLNRLLGQFVSQGKVFHSWFQNSEHASGAANLDDCAALMNALSFASAFTGERSFVRAFQFVAKHIFSEFFDPSAGTLFSAQKESDLPIRLHKIEESAVQSAHSHVVEATLMQQEFLKWTAEDLENRTPLEESLAKDLSEVWEPLLCSALGSVSLVAKEIPGSCPILLQIVQRIERGHCIQFNCSETTQGKVFQEVAQIWCQFLRTHKELPLGFAKTTMNSALTGENGNKISNQWRHRSSTSSKSNNHSGPDFFEMLGKMEPDIEGSAAEV